MKVRRLGMILSLSALASLGPALSKPLDYKLPDETAELKSGPQPGFDAAKNNCMACHSADYIRTQPPARGKAFWDVEVGKMIHLYHAPIDDADAKAIGEYLGATY